MYEDEPEDLKQIKFLIFSRGYHFTNICIDFKNIKYPNSYNQPIAKMEFPHFSDYRKLKYFPPIRIGLYGDANIHDQGFGLFSSSEIAPNVLIGEYAADLFNNS